MGQVSPKSLINLFTYVQAYVNKHTNAITYTRKDSCEKRVIPKNSRMPERDPRKAYTHA